MRKSPNNNDYKNPNNNFLLVPYRPPAAKKLSVLGTGRMKLSVLETSGDHLGPLGTIWEMASMTLSVSLRIRTFLSARIDPSRPPKHRRTNFKKSCRRKKSNIQKELKKTSKTTKTNIA